MYAIRSYYEDGRAVGLKMCECVMKGNVPEKVEGTEFELEADIIIAAIGQMGDLTGLDALNNGRGFIDIAGAYQVRITSYNVCYTKLLRWRFARPTPARLPTSPRSATRPATP